MAQDSKKLFVTAEKLKEMQVELDELTSVTRKEVSEKIKEALAYGDLSENAEYNEARDLQARVEARIRELEASIRNAEVFKEHTGGKETKSITVGSVVSIQEKGKKEPIELTIVGSTEADPQKNKISNESPIGVALLGQQPGEKIIVKAPVGDVEYTIKSAR